MTGAAGPMMGQNIGANQPRRVAQIYRAGLYIVIAYTLLLWALLALFSDWLIGLYQAEGITADLLHIYCVIQLPMFAGLGVLALSNGIFNNLGKPLWSTLFNGSRATVATLVFCFIGDHYFGLYGVVIGSSLTFAVFGVFTLIAALSLFRQKYPGESIFSAKAAF
jgi:Na+-driven multidrug efflux pump